MRSIATMLVALGACVGREAHCNLLCDDATVVTAHTQIPTADLVGDTIVICVNDTTCTSEVFDAACLTAFSCVAEGAFAASLTVTGDAGAIVSVDISNYVGKVDGDVWSISIVDSNGASRFSDQARATYDVVPQPCFPGPPCHDLSLDL